MPRKHSAKNKNAAATSAFAIASAKAGIAHAEGKGALQGAYRSRVVSRPGSVLTYSIDLDSHFKSAEPNSPRWDYGIGVKQRNGAELAFWVEPHPASSTGEVQKMIDKLNWLKSKLETKEFAGFKALCDATSLQGVIPYRWQTSEDGVIRITAKSKEARLLALKGLAMPSRQITLP
jgi:hypothetical protein